MVTGIRVQGAFFPEWSQDKHPIVLIDTEGLGHKADAEANLPNSIVDWFGKIDVILLVDKATDSMANSVGKALETIATAGHTQKLIVTFTHMEELKGDNLSNIQAKEDHLRNSIRNVIQNRVNKGMTRQNVQSMEKHLEQNTFFLGFLDSMEERKLSKVRPDLERMFEKLIHRASLKPYKAFPVYSYDNLVLAIQEGIKKFRNRWKDILSLNPKPWQSIKAVNRRYAEGWDNDFHLQPTADLRDSISTTICQFLENPIEWNGKVCDEEKSIVVDRIKTKFTDKLIPWTKQRLMVRARSQWLKAYQYSGQGSTFKRTQEIESLYEHWISIPSSTANLEVQAFIDEIKSLVKGAVDEVEKEIAI